MSTDIIIWVYTGYTFRRSKTIKVMAEILDNVDTIVDEEIVLTS